MMASTVVVLWVCVMTSLGCFASFVFGMFFAARLVAKRQGQVANGAYDQGSCVSKDERGNTNVCGACSGATTRSGVH